MATKYQGKEVNVVRAANLKDKGWKDGVDQVVIQHEEVVDKASIEDDTSRFGSAEAGASSVTLRPNEERTNNPLSPAQRSMSNTDRDRIREGQEAETDRIKAGSHHDKDRKHV